MADQPPSASQQTGKTGKARNRRTPKAGSERGPYSQEYHHFVNIAQSALLTESKRLEIKQKTGADVELGPDPSDKQKPKVVIIRGFRPFQIEAAARLINEETNTQEPLGEGLFLEFFPQEISHPKSIEDPNHQKQPNIFENHLHVLSRCFILYSKTSSNICYNYRHSGFFLKENVMLSL